ncbi:MAG: deoxyribodipyrimidine photo-lyase [Bdellovibrionales bacterium]|nr:deoxyribodipyrimidine photo-lyase [Bdellovibrionales bacterium]
MYKVAIHIFRRDLRLFDNTAFIAATTRSEKVLPCFFLDPRQLENNPYRSESAVLFMRQSLEELDEELKRLGGRLFLFAGEVESLLASIVREASAQAVFFNRDYTPFSKRRDQRIVEICKSEGIAVESYPDALLSEPGDVLKQDGQPYRIFTPFYKAASRLNVPAPQEFERVSLFASQIDGEVAGSFKAIVVAHNPRLACIGGRSNGLKQLDLASKLLNYAEDRNIPAVHGTSLLSPHNKFGTLSIREVNLSLARAFGRDAQIVRELYWRDFFTHIAAHFPHIFKGAFNPQYDQIEWDQEDARFSAWCAGETGFPLVDAGMRELNETGFMHNRLRMVTASFLVKDLHISWQSGERYFARKLIDYDPSVNNGNWQWAASTGCDAQPYFRIFNPWLQQKKFDKDCLYIKRWIPALRPLSPSEIHKLQLGAQSVIGYPNPIVDHATQKEKTEAIFHKALGRIS